MLVRTPQAQFQAQFDPKKPVFIEADGACSGNPGPGGCGFILAQEQRKRESYGAKADISNNEAMNWV
jgi:ribonuclease HI